MRDLNEFRFSGTVQRFDRIQTNTGTAMVSFSVMCWKERIRTIAFKALADQTELSPGDWVEVRGHIQSTSWTDKHGQLRTGWQCIAHELHRADCQQPDQLPPRTSPPARQQSGRQPDPGELFKYTDGPF
jgi:single-stranded DNA-binding protein